jgi:hypothetical protein
MRSGTGFTPRAERVNGGVSALMRCVLKESWHGHGTLARGFVKSDRRGITILILQVIDSNPAAPTKDNQPKNPMLLNSAEPFGRRG